MTEPAPTYTTPDHDRIADTGGKMTNLNALIAEKVFGLEVIDEAWPCHFAPDCGYRSPNRPVTHREDWQALITEWGGHYWPVYASEHTPTPEQLATWKDDGDSFDPRWWYEPVPDYAGDGNAMLDLIAAMYRKQWMVTMLNDHAHDGGWARFCCGPTFGEHHVVSAEGETLPQAVALAALMALDVEIPAEYRKRLVLMRDEELLPEVG